MSVVNVVTGEIVEARDVGTLAVPDEVCIPPTLDGAVELLDRVGGLLWAGHWGTAAVVYAYRGPRITGTPPKMSKVTF